MQLSTLFQLRIMGMTPISKYKRSEVVFLEIWMTAHRELWVKNLQLGLGSINHSRSVIVRKGDVVIATDVLPSRTLFGRKC